MHSEKRSGICHQPTELYSATGRNKPVLQPSCK